MGRDLDGVQMSGATDAKRRESCLDGHKVVRTGVSGRMVDDLIKTKGDMVGFGRRILLAK